MAEGKRRGRGCHWALALAAWSQTWAAGMAVGLSRLSPGWLFLSGGLALSLSSILFWRLVWMRARGSAQPTSPS